MSEKKITGQFHKSTGDLTGEMYKYQHDILHKFHDTDETFEVYECPQCEGHFLVEAEALDSIDEFWCPYCRCKFVNDQQKS